MLAATFNVSPAAMNVRLQELGLVEPRGRWHRSGRSNTGIAGILVVSDGAVEKHIANIFAKLGLAPSETDNRRVLAVLRYLQA